MNRKQRRVAAKLGQKPQTSSATAVTGLLQTGVQHHQSGRLTEAVACYQSVLAKQPDHADALHLLGLIAHQMKRYNEATQLISRAIEKNGPGTPLYLTNLSVILIEQHKYEEALSCCEKALVLKRDHELAWLNRAIALAKLKKFEDALTSYDKVLALAPDNITALSDKALMLKRLGRPEEALACSDKALQLNPHHLDSLANRGLILHDLKRFDEALASCEKAIAIDPNNAVAHSNESLVRLALGDFKRGFAKYEWRWKVLGLEKPRDFNQPYWLGEEPIAGKRILLYNEQGLGDAIQFCRYIPHLAEQGAHVIVETTPPLKELISGLPGVAQCVSMGKELPEFDLHCSFNSLPLAFKTRLETIPSTTPYLQVPIPSTNWDERLGRKDRPRIGLVWSGNPKQDNDRTRSTSLRTLLPLLEADATFISLQKDVRPDDVALLKERTDILNLGPSFNSFADTAAVISQLDLVISVCTSVAHLTGALGRPVWVLLSFVPDWRWLFDRDDNPWYPTARLFRQSESRQWSSVIEHMREALEEFIAKQSA